MMPSGWKQAHIKEVGTVVTGSTPPTKDLDNYGDEFMFVSPADMGSHKYIRSSAKMVSKKGFDKGRKVPPKSTLFTCIGSTIGKIGMNEVELITNQQINSVIPNSDVDPDFIYYSLENVAQRIKKLAGQQAVPLINKSDFEEEIITLPVSKNEQEKIAKILSTWDEAIDRISKLIGSKEKYKGDLAFKILSGECRVRGHSQSWSKKKLKELGSCVRGLTYSPKNIVDDGLLVLRSSNILNGQIALEDNVYVDVEVQDQYLSKPGDILICVRNGSRNLIGKTALIPENLTKATHGAFMSVFRTKYSSYVFQLFQTEMYYGQVAKNLGATINSINNSDLLEFSFPFPNDNKEIQEIAAILESFDREISLLRRIGFSYQKQKQGLMQQLLTGKKRVKA